MQTGNQASTASMSLTSPDLPARLEFWFYRVGGYLMLNVLDDPAWLALMFC